MREATTTRPRQLKPAATLLALAMALAAASAGLLGWRAAVAVTAPQKAWEQDLTDPITGSFRRHALNALLVPLLDDHEPPRWTNAAVQFFCGPATRVEINGQPLVPGTPVPATPFTVRWQIDQCWPFDYAAFELSGSVDLQVNQADTGLRAIVNAQHLRIATAKGTGRLEAPFIATMSMDPETPRSAPQSALRSALQSAPGSAP